MLTKKENLRETIHGGNPEHFVDNFEYLHLFFDTTSAKMMPEIELDVPFQNAWGVWQIMATGEPGMMPLTDGDRKLVKDVCEWESSINRPELIFPEEEWEMTYAQLADVDRDEVFIAPFIGNGIFEKLHYFMGMEDAMVNFYEEPEAMHDLIDFCTQWEIDQAEQICNHVHPDALFHHDDWGSQKNSFLAPEMFEEFIVPAYEKIYGFWKENGVEIVVHHSDSYAANLLPFMERMHIDIWQGVINENNIPHCIETWPEHHVTVMGGLNNGIYDKPDTTIDQIEAGFRELLDACPNNGKHYLIPGLTMGEPGSVFKHVYPLATEAIYKLSKEYF